MIYASVYVFLCFSALTGFIGLSILSKYSKKAFALVEAQDQILKLKNEATDSILRLAEQSPNKYDLFVEYADWWFDVEAYNRAVSTKNIWKVLTADLHDISYECGKFKNRLQIINEQKWSSRIARLSSQTRPMAFPPGSERLIYRLNHSAYVGDITLEQMQALEKRRLKLNAEPNLKNLSESKFYHIQDLL